MIGSTFYSQRELDQIPFGYLGKNVLISRMTSIINPEKLYIGDYSRVDDFCFLSGQITLGRHVHIGGYTALYGEAGIEFNDFAGISPKGSIFTVTDDFKGRGLTGPTVKEEYRKVHKGKVVLKRHVAIASHVLILPNTTLNEGVSVLANSIIMGDVPEWSVWRGNPARMVMERKREIILANESRIRQEEGWPVHY